MTLSTIDYKTGTMDAATIAITSKPFKIAEPFTKELNLNFRCKAQVMAMSFYRFIRYLERSKYTSVVIEKTDNKLLLSVDTNLESVKFETPLIEGFGNDETGTVRLSVEYLAAWLKQNKQSYYTGRDIFISFGDAQNENDKGVYPVEFRILFTDHWMLLAPRVSYE